MARIILGVTGGIAAVKAPGLLRSLKKNGHEIVPVLTNSARDFITPMSMSVLAQHEVPDAHVGPDGSITHLELAKTADILLIAPATANFMAKCAHGLADDLLSQIFLAFKGTVIMAPAMHTEMYTHPMTQSNIQRLKQIGVQILGPISGELACEDEGLGRMLEPDDIAQYIDYKVTQPDSLSGKRVLITAGGTREMMDSVRCITNLSSGKLGEHLANYAHANGATVTLISSQDQQSSWPYTHVKVSDTSSLQEALKKEAASADIIYMAAAVSDFTLNKADHKLSRSSQARLDLIPTNDLLSQLTDRYPEKRTVGFCLTDRDLKRSAQSKLVKKNVDFMVANTPASFGQDKRSLMILKRGETQPLSSLEQVPITDAVRQIVSLTTADV